MVGFWQLRPLILIDVEADLWTRFPEARVVIIFRDFVKAELFIIVRADPFGRVDGAFFQRRTVSPPAKVCGCAKARHNLATASAGCGGKTMKEVWRSFKNDHPELLSSLIEKYLLVPQVDSDNDLVNVELLIDEATKFLSVAKIRKSEEEEQEFRTILSALYKGVTKAALLTGDKFKEKNQGKENTVQIS